MRPQRHRLDRIAEHLADLDRDRVDLEHAGLDLGEVQDVFDHAQQRVGAHLDQVEILALLGLECGVVSSSVMPMTPFIGVRISWLMLARNWLFAALLSSAFSGRGQLDVDGRPDHQLVLELQRDGAPPRDRDSRRWRASR